MIAQFTASPALRDPPDSRPDGAALRPCIVFHTVHNCKIVFY